MKQFESECDVVLSTRIRFARNLKDYPFPSKLSEQKRKEVIELVKDAIFGGNSVIAKDFEYYDMSSFSEIEKFSLVERHLISPSFADSKKTAGLLLSTQKIGDESFNISIMICEEDHIRLQVLSSGLNFENTFDLAKKIDMLLNERLSLAFSDRFGYLTQCPTNVGTGMRASVMLHLPTIFNDAMSNRFQNKIAQFGCTIRGTYGEGSEVREGICQLSNQVSLGKSEEDIINNLLDVAHLIIDRERKASVKCVKDLKMQDVITKSLGILKYAKLLSEKECLNLLSNLRIGVSTGLIDDVNMKTIDKILNNISPATLMKNLGKRLTATERDQQRAILVQKLLSEK